MIPGLLPVLDILDGIVVRGVAGRRSDYRPIVSRLTSSHEPLAVANAIRNEFGLSQYYIADLDGIMHQRPNLSLYRRLIAGDLRLLIDPGIREPDEARSIQQLKGAEVIVGLETCRTPDELRRVVASGPNVTFSLDLFQGVPRIGQPPVTVHSQRLAPFPPLTMRLLILSQNRIRWKIGKTVPVLLAWSSCQHPHPRGDQILRLAVGATDRKRSSGNPSIPM